MRDIELCPTCEGSGKSTELYEEEGSHGRTSVRSRDCVCPTCEGSGRVIIDFIYHPYPLPKKDLSFQRNHVQHGGEEMSTDFKQYRRIQVAELRPYVPGEEAEGVSISEADMLAGSPKVGDMIARNPKNHADQWLVAAQYFADNFEPL